MALSPNIPTSFVPHPGGSSSKRYKSDFSGAFAFFGYGVLALGIALAIGVFLYGRVLTAQKDAKDAQLAQAEASIDPSTVTGFVRLRDRLASSATLINNHVAYSKFFGVLEGTLPTTTRFSALTLTLDDAGSTKLTGQGVAKNFNALAAASTAFAKDGRIKDAIFSNISVTNSGSVTFSLTATLDKALTAFTVDAVPAQPAAVEQPAATSTAATSTDTTP